MTREHTPRPGVTWETRLVPTETVIEDPDTTSPADMNPAIPPRENRATRRQRARQARKKTR